MLPYQLFCSINYLEASQKWSLDAYFISGMQAHALYSLTIGVSEGYAAGWYVAPPAGLNPPTLLSEGKKKD